MSGREIVTTLGRLQAGLRPDVVKIQEFLEKLRNSLGPDWPADRELPLSRILEASGVVDTLYFGPVAVDGHERAMRLFACSCARRVLPFFERACPGKDWPRQAIEAAEQYVRGELTESELALASDAAHNAYERDWPPTCTKIGDGYFENPKLLLQIPALAAADSAALAALGASASGEPGDRLDFCLAENIPPSLKNACDAVWYVAMNAWDAETAAASPPARGQIVAYAHRRSRESELNVARLRRETREAYLAAKREEHGTRPQDKPEWKAVTEAKNRVKRARAEAREVRAQARELIRAACEPGKKALAGAQAELEREFIRLCLLEGEYGKVREF